MPAGRHKGNHKPKRSDRTLVRQVVSTGNIPPLPPFLSPLSLGWRSFTSFLELLLLPLPSHRDGGEVSPPSWIYCFPLSHRLGMGKFLLLLGVDASSPSPFPLGWRSSLPTSFLELLSSLPLQLGSKSFPSPPFLQGCCRSIPSSPTPLTGSKNFKLPLTRLRQESPFPSHLEVSKKKFPSPTNCRDKTSTSSL